MKFIFSEGYKSMDYISSWFFLASNYIRVAKAKCSFVSTNSICQGEQVALIWPKVLKDDLEIIFAHNSFKWNNNAKDSAGVTVVIIGLSKKEKTKKSIYDNLIKTEVERINPYLINYKNIYVESRTNPLSDFCEMNFGNMPADGGQLLFNTEEKNTFLRLEPASKDCFKKLISAHEFLNGQERWCLWLEEFDLSKINKLPLVKERVDNLREIRLNSSRPKLAEIPHLFAQITQEKNQDFILIPCHSSESRDYVPIGFFNSSNVAHNSCLIISGAQLHLFSVLTSRIHMSWLKTVGGKLKTDYRYSKNVVYNTFPFPSISKQKKEELTQSALNIIDERLKHSEKTLAELYDPNKMPEGLREAHHQNDLAVERCYRSNPFSSDEERLEYLFKLYEKMIEEEKDSGTLFAKEKKTRKRR